MSTFKPIPFGTRFGDWTTKHCLPGSLVVCSCKCGATHTLKKQSLITGASTRCRKCARLNRGPISTQIKQQRQAQKRQDFWMRVDKSSGPDSCWPWQGPIFEPGGYGQCPEISGTTVAHKVAWILTNGPVPDEMKVCHSCDYPPCCNPLHLWLGTSKENSEDMVLKGRSAKGTRHPNAILNEKLVKRIVQLNMQGVEGKIIALRLNLNRCTVRDVLSGRTWSHITSELRVS